MENCTFPYLISAVIYFDSSANIFHGILCQKLTSVRSSYNSQSLGDHIMMIIKVLSDVRIVFYYAISLVPSYVAY